MATITKTIGSAGGRDYSDPNLWDADLDNGAIYSAGDTAIGEMYNDSVYTAGILFMSGSTLPLNTAILRAASGQGHTGTAGTGVRVVLSVAEPGLDIYNDPMVRTASHIEFNSNATTAASIIDAGINGSGSGTVNINQCICHNLTRTLTLFGVRVIGSIAGTINFNNNIVYNISATGGTNRNVTGINITNTTAVTSIQNCTVDTITNNTPSGLATGINVGNSANITVQNCIATNTNGSSSGGLNDFVLGASSVKNNNASEDATATGTGSITGLAPTSQYVSVGSNYLLKSTSSCINAGADLGTSPANIQFDIVNFDRDTPGVLWDISANEFVNANKASMFAIFD